ncbi:LuxR C-terminal-related transcriptional regulator [Embleya sp. NBC_00888]|uniref:helix-turn-helix domain-containing protein n=1 Tax=Embleya sp. NBC_00888 TaxID=2975960 RepID=UPI00386759ED
MTDGPEPTAHPKPAATPRPRIPHPTIAAPEAASAKSTESARPAQRAAHPDRLTDREVEVLRLIVDGLTNAGIAAALSIGEATVKTHINNAFAKINARNRTDAVRYADRRGLTRP